MRSALITGGSRGLGFATARRLAAGGWGLALVARGESHLHTAVAELQAAGAEVVGIPGNVRDARAMVRVMETVRERVGGLNALINNAGLMVGDRSLADVTPGLWRDILETNLHGAFFCIHAALPLLLEGGGGTIINLTSGAAVRTGFLNVAYGVSKAGLDRLTLGVDAKMRDRGIRCVSLSPSMSATDTVRAMYADQDVDAMAAPPEDTAKAIEWLLGGAAERFCGKVVTVKECLALM